MREETYSDNDGWSWRFRWVDETRDNGVLAWDDYVREVQLHKGGWAIHMHKGGWAIHKHRFDPTATDCGPLGAYCRGDMPAHVFADWVEENAPDFPAEGLAILRADLG